MVKDGVPWNEAWNMSHTRRLAVVVAMREIDGERYDWAAKSWDKP